MKLTKKLSQLLLAATVLLSASAVSQLYLAQPAFAAANVQPEPDTPLDKSNLQKSMTVQSVEKLKNGVKLDLGDYEAYIRLLSTQISKISILKKGEKEKFSGAITKKDWATPKFTVIEDNKKILLKTDDITVDINKSPFGIKHLDKNGNVINEDAKQGVGYENGKPYVFKKTDKSENFYGFGEQAGDLNKRGYNIGFWNTDAYTYDKNDRYLYGTNPFFIGLKNQKAYGIYFDDTYRSYFNMAKESDDYYYFYANGGQLTYYFMYGPEIKDVVNHYTDLTGKMDLPPEWALGFHQSKWGYLQNDIVRVAKTYREKNIPLDTMHMDIDWMDKYRVFTWDKSGYKYPDPDKLNEELNQLHVHQVAITDPGVKKDPNFPIYQQGVNGNYFIKKPDGSILIGEVWPGESAFPNFFKKDVRDWWALNHKSLFDKGVDGFWNDMNELTGKSSTYDWGDPDEPLDPSIVWPHNHMPLDSVLEQDDGSKMLGSEAHNIYPLYMAEASKEAFKKLKPNTRPFVLTRASFSGSQRYATLWTGDNTSSWGSLALSLPMNENIGLSGMPFVGNDIGGFAKPDDDYVTPELFARWIEVGAFLPFSRDHYAGGYHEGNGQEPWVFGKDVENISRKYINMRYELMPYLYNAFKSAHDNGQPIQQPLVYTFQHDPNTYNIQDQYMFGNSLMLAPVITKSETSRKVYLPAGTKWIDYWTGKEYKGGQTITKQADLGTLPIYVKKDSIIPRREVQQYTGQKKLTNLILDTYLDHRASYSYYQDDANTEDYMRGEFNITDFSLKNKGNHIEFKQNKKVQKFASDIQYYTLKLHDTTEPKKVQADNQKYTKTDGMEEMNQQDRAYYYDANEKVLYVKIPVNEDHKVFIDLK